MYIDVPYGENCFKFVGAILAYVNTINFAIVRRTGTEST